MRLKNYLRTFIIFLRVFPWTERPRWTQMDAKTLREYLASESGAKLKAYFVNYVLQMQAEAIISTSNLRYKSGACSGAKSIISTLDALAEPENYNPTEDADDT